MLNTTIRFDLEPDLSAQEFINVLERSTLAERRPVSFPETIESMLRNADIILTARNDERTLIGVARSISDFSFCTYLSDLAVDKRYQRQGIGRELIERTHAAAGKQTRLILLSAPAAVSYYPHIGMVPHESCWQIEPQSKAP